MTRRRIVIVHNWIEVGINIQNRQLAYELSKLYDVWFLSGSRLGAKEIKVNDNLKVVEWPNKRPTKLKDLWFCWKFFKEIQPDIVMAHFTGIRLSMIAAFFAGVRHRVAWYHILSKQLENLVNNKRKEKWMIRKFKSGFLFSNHIITFHEFGKKDAMDFLNKRANQISVIPNGMLLKDCTEKIGFELQRPVFLFLGRLHISKGVDTLIKIFKIISEKYPEVQLKIVGEGDMGELLKEMILKSGLEKNVQMTGKTFSYEGVFGYLQNAYALLVPSRIDNYPTVIIEAMSSGVPVIGARSGGVPEMIKDGEDGSLCETENENDWAGKIELLIQNKNLRNEMAANAIQSYKERFTMDKHVENVIRFIESLK